MTAAEFHGIDEYLGAIYELVEEGTPAVQARIARRLGVSRASVSEQIGRLRTMGMIEPKGRDLELTVRGFAIAEDAVRRHRMSERFLTDVLKVPWHLSHQEANRFQSGITGEVDRRMGALLGGPATCPHGNPIPGTGAKLPKDMRPLREFAPGDKVILVRLVEDVELDTDVLRYLEQHGLMPGVRIVILATAPDGTMSVAAGAKKSSVGGALTDNLWVRPARAK